jgi:hypothetical protein
MAKKGNHAANTIAYRVNALRMMWLELSQLAAGFTSSFTDETGRLAESVLPGPRRRPRLELD